MRPSAFLIAILSAFLCGLSFGAERPNIVFILADDMGWRDPACFGGKAVPTPHMDALAASGLRMERFYSSNAGEGFAGVRPCVRYLVFRRKRG
jgi:hypothetical protein